MVLHGARFDDPRPTDDQWRAVAALPGLALLAFERAIDDELAQARIGWKAYQSTRKRDAIYDYLRAVFKIVRRWRNEHRAKASSHQALRTFGRAARIRNLQPFGVVILCTSDPLKVDAKTRSKWSRALRYCERFKPDAQSLGQFIKSQGGINECAARWSDRLAELAKNARSLSRSPAARF